ncbi:MAG: hypothetical protein IKD76_00310 [Clostridia bacterium]|nr:hypothetical protein [Clostridia bacterium]
MLRQGYDIFAVDMAKAEILATVASPIKEANWHAAHKGKGDRCDHYHPVGIKWYINKEYAPHVWYLYE